ncbi:hypothetical protein Cni_G03475 [Canna indica]|uniref:Uncharacterized protein n=1 Tax=Canna indica TaxID=4628 RepID=A0AAQ3Q197_9LILI|nr:hypothetical protein Cni_G03475 [Canna indica]
MGVSFKIARVGSHYRPRIPPVTNPPNSADGDAESIAPLIGDRAIDPPRNEDAERVRYHIPGDVGTRVWMESAKVGCSGASPSRVVVALVSNEDDWTLVARRNKDKNIRFAEAPRPSSSRWVPVSSFANVVRAFRPPHGGPRPSFSAPGSRSSSGDSSAYLAHLRKSNRCFNCCVYVTKPSDAPSEDALITKMVPGSFSEVASGPFHFDVCVRSAEGIAADLFSSLGIRSSASETPLCRPTPLFVVNRDQALCFMLRLLWALGLPPLLGLGVSYAVEELMSDQVVGSDGSCASRIFLDPGVLSDLGSIYPGSDPPWVNFPHAMAPADPGLPIFVPSPSSSVSSSHCVLIYSRRPRRRPGVIVRRSSRLLRARSSSASSLQRAVARKALLNGDPGLGSSSFSEGSAASVPISSPNLGSHLIPVASSLADLSLCDQARALGFRINASVASVDQALSDFKFCDGAV